MSRRRQTCSAPCGESGASAVEYALLIAGVAIAVFAAVFFLGSALSQDFTNVGSTVSSAN
ncbi:MAG: Flp family type IVb pilin [Candidatus Nanopelagicales bacterium]|nr:Flp family type IVb pilin [Candidatus Nanopelagicales bacterium]